MQEIRLQSLVRYFFKMCHSRESGNPALILLTLDPSFRWDDTITNKAIKFLSFLLVSCFLLLFSFSLFASNDTSYTSLGKPVDDAIWGLTKADLDGDSKSEIYLIGRENIYEYTDKATLFQTLGDLTQAHHIYSCDVDDDARDELIVSAVRPFGHYSYIIHEDLSGVEKEEFGLQLRAIKDKDGRCALLGVKGKDVYSMSYANKKIEAVKKMKICSSCNLYNFNYLSDDEIVRVSDDGKFELWKSNGRSFKKQWRGGRGLGRTLNVIDSERFSFAPLPISEDEIFSVQYQQPAAQIVGRVPITDASRMLRLKRDEAIGFVEIDDQKWLPSVITDYILDKGADGEAKRIIYTMQVGGSLFKEAGRSIVGCLDL